MLLKLTHRCGLMRRVAAVIMRCLRLPSCFDAIAFEQLLRSPFCSALSWRLDQAFITCLGLKC